MNNEHLAGLEFVGKELEILTDLQEIFNTLKPLLAAYAPPMAVRVDEPGRYDLWSRQPVLIAGRKRKEVFFAALILQKGHVGFYFMPIYSDPDKKTFFPPELLSLLKGKSCFHIRRLDDGLRDQVKASLEAGYEIYRDKGWV